MKCPNCQCDNSDDSRFCGICGTELHPVGKEIITKTTETFNITSKELIEGATLAGRYEIIEEIGSGGMGTVFKAIDKKINEKVAVKVIKPEVAFNKDSIERFGNELKIARKISHKNVCRMYSLEEAGEIKFITMEYVSGENLRMLMRRIGQFSIRKSIFIAKQLYEGLSEAHRLGVVHRDLKPHNIMIDEKGNTKIMDFGIARSQEIKGITESGMIIGTPEYMSPEQTEGERIDHRSDIYSLGCVLYEMLTERVPFEGDTPIAVGIKHKSEKPRDPKELNPNIPKDLSRLILKCLEKDKKERYQSTAAILADLEAIDKGIPTTDRIIPKKNSVLLKKKKKKVFILALVILFSAIIVLITLRFIPFSSIFSDEDTFSSGIKYLENKKYSKAIGQFKKSLFENPNNFEAQLIIANILKEQGKIDESIQEYKKAIVINEEDSRPYKHLGELLEQKNDIKKAMNYYKKYLEIEPESKDFVLVDQKVKKLANQLQPKRETAKQERIKKASQKPTQFEPTLIEKARDYVKFSMYEDAITLLEKEIKEHLKNAEAHFLLGQSYLHINEEEKSEVSFNRAIVIKPTYKAQVAMEYIKSGKKILEEYNYEHAERRFEQALRFESTKKKEILGILIKKSKELSKSNINGGRWCIKEALKYSENQRNIVGNTCQEIARELLNRSDLDGSRSFIDLAKELNLLDLVQVAKQEDIKFKKQVEAAYPVAAREAGITKGKVKLEVIFDIYGRVLNIKVLESDPLFDQAAIDAVRQWIFEPIIENGKPKPAVIRINYSIELK